MRAWGGIPRTHRDVLTIVNFKQIMTTDSRFIVSQLHMNPGGLDAGESTSLKFHANTAVMLLRAEF